MRYASSSLVSIHRRTLFVDTFKISAASSTLCSGESPWGVCSFIMVPCGIRNTSLVSRICRVQCIRVKMLSCGLAGEKSREVRERACQMRRCFCEGVKRTAHVAYSWGGSHPGSLDGLKMESARRTGRKIRVNKEDRRRPHGLRLIVLRSMNRMNRSDQLVARKLF